MIIKYYDYTRVSTYVQCPRKFYFRHVRHWRPEGVSAALAFGSGWHAGMDVIWSNIHLPPDTLAEFAVEAWRSKMIEEGIDIDHPVYSLNEIRTEGTAKEMFTNYIKKNSNFIKEVELIGIEQPFAVPLTDAETPMYVGRRDKIFRQKGKVNVCEHKTTSAYKKGGPFRASWINSFSPNSQVDGYSYATYLEYGEDFKGVWIDAALVHKMDHNGFRFIPIERMYSMLDAWLWEVKHWIDLIERDKERLAVYVASGRSLGFLPAFPKNTGNCTTYTGCSYKDICRFINNPAEIDDAPDDFVIDRWSPFKHLELDRIGLIDTED